jgi:hypothetical protein
MTYVVMKQKMRTQMQNATQMGGIYIFRYVLRGGPREGW